MEIKPIVVTIDLMENFFERFEKTDGCWEWAGIVDSNYGYSKLYAGPANKKRYVFAHRVSYLIHKGDIPENYTIDHLCRNRSCVNPEHLEAVTLSENTRRAWVSRGYDKQCGRGHAKSEYGYIYVNPNTGVKNPRCRACLATRYERHRNNIESLNCLWCGIEFKPTHARTKCCSRSCGHYASHARRRELAAAGISKEGEADE